VAIERGSGPAAYQTMRPILGLLLLFSGSGSADGTTDSAEINHVIAQLNLFPRPMDLFTRDADGRSVPEELRKGRPFVYRVEAAPRDTGGSPSSPPSPRLVISHEPWGEASITPAESRASVEIVNPRIETQSTRFITPDVALVDGHCTYADTAQKIPLLFVMKKQQGAWKIASIRVLLAPQ